MRYHFHPKLQSSENFQSKLSRLRCKDLKKTVNYSTVVTKFLGVPVKYELAISPHGFSS